MTKELRLCLFVIGYTFMEAVLKLAVGHHAKSPSLIADGFHSLFDMMTTAIIAGILYTSQFEFRWNIFRKKLFQDMWACALIMGLMIYTLYKLMMLPEDISRIENPYSPIFLVVLLTGAKYLLYRYQSQVAASANSPLLRYDALESKMDLITGVVVLLTTAAHYADFDFEQVAVALIAVIVITHGFYFLWNEGILQRMGRGGGDLILWLGRKCHHGVRFCLYKPSLWAFSGIGWVIYTSTYVLKPGEMGIEKIAGKVNRTIDMPGLYILFPRPLGALVRIKQMQMNQLTYSLAEEPTPYVLTKDHHLVEVALSMTYRITSPKLYIESATSPVEVLSEIVGDSLTRVIGQYDIDDVLLKKKLEVLEAIRSAIARELRELEIGLSLLSLQFSQLSPPKAIVSAFHEVTSAKEDQRAMIDKAHAEAHELMAQGRVIAHKVLQEAIAKQEIVLSEASSFAERYHRLKKHWAKRPDQDQALWLDNWQKIAKSARVELIDEIHSKNSLLRVVDR